MPEEKTIKLKGVWVKCPNCGHEWDTISTFVKVSCPSCNAKVDRIPKPKEQISESNIPENKE